MKLPDFRLPGPSVVHVSFLGLALILALVQAGVSLHQLIANRRWLHIISTLHALLLTIYLSCL